MNHWIKIKEKQVGFLRYRRQLIFKASDKLVRKLTSVPPRSRNAFTRLCECRIIPTHISCIAKVLGPNHLSMCSLINEQSCIMRSP